MSISRYIVISGVFLASGALVACGGPQAKQSEPAAGAEPAAGSTAESTAGEDPVQAQLARGGAAFGKYCAECHGDSGQGTADAPPLVGEGALPLDPRPEQEFRTTQFRTAMDVAQFAVENMPPQGDKPPTSEYWDILAFALSANGIQLTEPVGPDNAASFVLHP